MNKDTFKMIPRDFVNKMQTKKSIHFLSVNQKCDCKFSSSIVKMRKVIENTFYVIKNLGEISPPSLIKKTL